MSARLPIRGHDGTDWGLDLFVDTWGYIPDKNGKALIQQVNSGLAVEVDVIEGAPIYGYDLRARRTEYNHQSMQCTGIETDAIL